MTESALQVCIGMSDCSDSAALPSTASHSFLLSVLSCIYLCLYALWRCTFVYARHGVCSACCVFVKATALLAIQY